MTKQSASPIQPITAEEFARVRATQAAKKGGPEHGRSPETSAALALKPGEGIKVPCHWQHGAGQGRKQCNGANVLRSTARRMGHKTLVSCLDGVVYIWRLADPGPASP